MHSVPSDPGWTASPICSDLIFDRHMAQCSSSVRPVDDLTYTPLIPIAPPVGRLKDVLTLSVTSERCAPVRPCGSGLEGRRAPILSASRLEIGRKGGLPRSSTLEVVRLGEEHVFP